MFEKEGLGLKQAGVVVEVSQDMNCLFSDLDSH